MSVLCAIPLFLSLCMSVLAFLLKGDKRFEKIGLLGFAGLVVSSGALLYYSAMNGLLILEIGGWRMPYGISMQVDVFSATINFFISILGLCAYMFSLDEIKEKRSRAGYYSAMFTLFAGANGVLLTGDLFNMYVWVEVLVVSSFLLLSMGQNKKQIKGALPYVLLNFLGSMFILSSIGLIYGLTGALNFAQISLLMDGLGIGPSATFGALFLAGFGIKCAIFPLFFWLPESYHRPPAAVSAFFAGVVTKVGVCALFKVYGLLFYKHMEVFQGALIWIGVFTMVSGVIGAVALYDVRRVLSYHIISQIGYMIFGLGLFGAKAWAASIFFIVHNILAKSNLFFIGAEMNRLGGSYNLQKTRGLYNFYPLISLLFFISAFSLTGIPPFSGFWGKLGLVEAGFEANEYLASSFALLVGLLTTYSMVKIWILGFWETPKSEKCRGPKNKYQMKRIVPIFILSMLSLYIGLWPEMLLSLSKQGSEQLLRPKLYQEQILGGVR
ncbi:MAG: Na+/H+ antiporter subunit D [Halobacteriovoraceae bacterium]|nr:Na+/H+ antiporter subunit D [Halobacteriovoraceae bacterium]